MSTPQQVSISERRIDLDWVRILAFGLLIFYHVGMLCVSWGRWRNCAATAGLMCGGG
ncbi:peptidoglycan/LPS O-acetylase OafA/YrhL [Bradyrhizobium sp. S3.3.6]